MPEGQNVKIFHTGFFNYFDVVVSKWKKPIILFKNLANILMILNVTNISTFIKIFLFKIYTPKELPYLFIHLFIYSSINITLSQSTQIIQKTFKTDLFPSLCLYNFGDPLSLWWENMANMTSWWGGSVHKKAYTIPYKICSDQFTKRSKLRLLKSSLIFFSIF